MSWQDEIDELARRKQLAQQMGGPEGIARQRARGKLTVRERIDALADAGSFREFMGLAGDARVRRRRAHRASRRNRRSKARACVDGRKLIVTAGDFTVRGGSAGTRGGLGQELASNVRAREWRIPYVRLLDAAGGSVRSFETMGRTYLPDGNIWTAIDVELLSCVPVVSAVMGSVAGLAGDQRVSCALQSDGEGQEPAVSRADRRS